MESDNLIDGQGDSRKIEENLCLKSPSNFASLSMEDPLQTQHFPRNAEIPNSFADSPVFQPFFGLKLDPNTHILLNNYMEEVEDSDHEMETPLADLFSQAKEKRKLGIMQVNTSKSKPDFGITPPKKGRKSSSEHLNIAGEDEGQIKITSILKVRKGATVPEQK